MKLFFLFALALTLHAEDLVEIGKDFQINLEPFGIMKLEKTIVRRDERAKRNFTEKKYAGSFFSATVEMIDNVEADYGNSLIKLYRTEMLGTYKNRRSPYTGESLTSIPCTGDNVPGLYPVNYMGKEADVLVLNATERNTLGVCQESLIKKKTLVFLGYSPAKKTFVSIKVFIPVEKFTKKTVEIFLSQFKEKLPL